MSIELTLLLIAIVSSILNGLTSSGGGILFVLLLMLLFTVTEDVTSIMHMVTTLAIFFTLASTLTGAGYYFKHKFYNKSMIIYLGISSLVGGYSGSILASMLIDEILQVIFFILTFSAAILMLLNMNHKLNVKYNISKYWLVPLGLAIGILGGMFGVGVGFLFLPVMIILYKIPVKSSIGSSLFCGAMLIIGALMGRLGTPYLELTLSLVVIIGGIIGTLLGGIISVRLKSEWLEKIIAVIMAGVALYFLYDFFLFELVQNSML